MNLKDSQTTAILLGVVNDFLEQDVDVNAVTFSDPILLNQNIGDFSTDRRNSQIIATVTPPGAKKVTFKIDYNRLTLPLLSSMFKNIALVDNGEVTVAELANKLSAVINVPFTASDLASDPIDRRNGKIWIQANPKSRSYIGKIEVAFNPPPVPQPTTVLSMAFDGVDGSTTYDDSLGSLVVTYGGTRLSDQRFRCGLTSAWFNGIDGCAEVLNTDNYALIGQDFTLRFWINPSKLSGDCLVIGKLKDNMGSWKIVLSNGQLKLSLSSDGAIWDIANAIVIGSLQVDKWQHVALTRSGPKFSTFVQGSPGPTVLSDLPLYVGNQSIVIGGEPSDVGFFRGYIDQLDLTINQVKYDVAYDAYELTDYCDYITEKLRAPVIPVLSFYNREPSLIYTNDGQGVVKGTGGPSWSSIRSTVSVESGRYYFEGICTGTSTAMNGVGLCNSNASLNNYLGNTEDGVIYLMNGEVRRGGMVVTTLPKAVVNNYICMAIDVGAKLFWIRLDNGNWNGVSTADPSIGVGGISFGANMTDKVFPGLSVTGTGERIQLNQGPTFTHPVPNGFTALTSSKLPTVPNCDSAITRTL